MHIFTKNGSCSPSLKFLTKTIDTDNLKESSTELLHEAADDLNLTMVQAEYIQQMSRASQLQTAFSGVMTPEPQINI